ncbi:MAG: hypothetical protein DME50_17620 [Verrucomicrobia bacterium]|nr:MAG: hypothetical protein DME50_17620 [Verrucomicrobiota bacterium]
MEWRAKGRAAVSRANVKDVARVVIAGGGIDIMNDMVKGGRLTPALVSPVATVIQIHAGKVAVEAGAIDTTRPGKAWAGIGVGPGIASVGRPVEEVSAIVGKATAAFVHARDVHVAFGKVTGDLDVADEGRAGGDLSRIVLTAKSFQETYIRP